MIYTWLDRYRGTRVIIDKAFEMRRLVEEELAGRGYKLVSNTQGNFEEGAVVPSHAALTYLLIGFDPLAHPQANEVMPPVVKRPFPENNEHSLALYEPSFLKMAGVFDAENYREPIFVEQDEEIFDGFGCDSSNEMTEAQDVPLSTSVRRLYRQSRPFLARTIADIATPLFHEGFDGDAEANYFGCIRLAIDRDAPCVQALAETIKMNFENRVKRRGSGRKVKARFLLE